MGLFSFLNKKKRENIQVNIVDNKKDHKDICDFLSIYKTYQDFLSTDKYISRKEYEKFYNDIKDKVEYISKLDNSNLLEQLCIVTNVIDIREKIHRIQNINLYIKTHNDKFIKEKKSN